MPKISVLTPTIRPKGLERVMESLEKQTFQDFELLVEVGLPYKGCDLSASLNRMVKRSKGELIVMLQDYIEINYQGLERFWKRHEEYPKTLMTGPKGVTKNLKSCGEVYYTNELAWDWRTQGILHEIQPLQWEADWASAPRQAFFDVGGYDEEYDMGWSWENAEIAIRIAKAGYNFMVDPENIAIGWNHNDFEPHPFNFPGNLNSHRFDETQRKLAGGLYKLNYL
jgi:GT2 family glycosyltransferase